MKNIFVKLISILAILICTAPAMAAQSVASPKTFFTQFIIAGGPIVWVVLIPMSIATVYLAVDLFLSTRKSKLIPAGISAEIISIAKTSRSDALVAALRGKNDIVSQVMLSVITKSQQTSQQKRYTQHIAAESLHEQSLKMSRKIEWFSIIGNVAPMVGLFGTVFGMIQAFNVLGVAGGQPRPDQLAAKISIALVTTFWGLLVAIPALAMHGIFKSKTDSIVAESAIEIETLLRRLNLPSEKKS